MGDLQIDSLIKAAAIVLGGLGIALLLAFCASKLPRLLGLEAAKLDNKYFVVDFSGIFLWLGIACFLVSLVIWAARPLLAKLF